MAEWRHRETIAIDVRKRGREAGQVEAKKLMLLSGVA